MATLRSVARFHARFLALAVAGAVLSGCAGGSANSPAGTSSADTPGAGRTTQPAAPPAQLEASVANGQQVGWRTQVRVDVTDGDLTEVTLRGLDDTTIDVEQQGQAWVTNTPLQPWTRYRLDAAAQSADGEPTRKTWRFRTGPAPRTDFPSVTPLAGSTVGVGHPVVIYLSHDVTFKKAFERRLQVTTSRPVTGSWGWIDDRTVAYRPQTFWPARTDVTVNLDLGKTQTAPGRFIAEDRTIKFRVGRAQVLRIDNATHQMKVVRDGRNIRTVPVSMGKPGFTTRSGIKVVMTQERSRFMDSDTVGIGGADAYALRVPFAMRITASGEFIHGAPWSESSQGRANVSHGCTNVSLANGRWLLNNTLIGDPVITRGTGRQAEVWNGLGALWNSSWADWQDRSALS